MSDSLFKNSPNTKQKTEEKNSSICLLDLFQEAWHEILRENPVASEGHVEIVTRDGIKKELTALEFWQQVIEEVETQKKDPDYLFTPEVEEIISEKFTTAIEPRLGDSETPIRLGDKYYVRRSTQPYLNHLNCGVDQWFVVQDFPPKPDIIKILRRRVKDKADDDDKLLLEKLILALENSPSKSFEQTGSMNSDNNPTVKQPVLESSPDSVPGEPSHAEGTQEKQIKGVGGGEPHSEQQVPTDESLAIPGTSGYQPNQIQTIQYGHGYRPRGVMYYGAPRQAQGVQQTPVAPSPAHMPLVRYSYIPSIQPLPAHQVIPYEGNALIPTNVFWRYETTRATGAPVQQLIPGMQMYPSFYPRLSTLNQPLIPRPPYPTSNPWVPQTVGQNHRVAYFPGENAQPAHVKAPDMSRFPYRYPTVNQTLAHQATIVYTAAYDQAQKRRRTQVSSELLLSHSSSYGYFGLNSESAQFENGQNSYLDRENLDLTDIGDQTLNLNTYYFQVANLDSEWIRSNLFTVNVPMGPTRCPSDLPPWSVNSGSEDRLLVVTLSPSVPPVQTVWSAQSPITSVFPCSLFPSTAICCALPTIPSITENISNNQIKEENEKTESGTKDSTLQITELDSEPIVPVTSNKKIDTLAEKRTATVKTTVENQQQISTKKSTKPEKADTKASTPLPSSSKGKLNKKGKNKQPARKAESESSVANFSDQQKTGAARKITVEFLTSALATASISSKKKNGGSKKSDPKPSTSKSISVEFYSNGQSSNSKPENQAKLTTDGKKIPQKKEQKMSVNEEKGIKKAALDKTKSVNSEKSTTDKMAVTDQKKKKGPILVDKTKAVNINKPTGKMSATEEKSHEETKSVNPEKSITGKMKKEQVDKAKPDASKPAVDEREYLVTPTIFEILESRKNIDPTELNKPPTNYMEDVIQRKERRWKLMDKVPGSPRLDIILDMIKRDNEMLAEEERLAKEKEQQSVPSTSKEPEKSIVVTDALLDSTEDPFEVLRLLADESRQKIEEDEKKSKTPEEPQEDLPPNTRVCDKIKVQLDDEELGLLDNLLMPSTFNPDVWVSDNTVLDLKEQLFDEWWADKAQSPKKDEQPAPEPSTSKTVDVPTKKHRKKKKSKKSSSEQAKYSGRDEATQTDTETTDTADEKTVEQKDSSCQIEPAAPSYAEMLKKKNQ